MPYINEQQSGNVIPISKYGDNVLGDLDFNNLNRLKNLPDPIDNFEAVNLKTLNGKVVDILNQLNTAKEQLISNINENDLVLKDELLLKIEEDKKNLAEMITNLIDVKQNSFFSNIDLNNNKIINLKNGTDNKDAVNLEQLNTKENSLGKPSSNGMVLSSDVNGRRIWVEIGQNDSISKYGDNVLGDLNFGFKSTIQNLPDPTGDYNPVNLRTMTKYLVDLKKYFVAQFSDFSSQLSKPTSDIDLNSQYRIYNLLDAINTSEPVTFGQFKEFSNLIENSIKAINDNLKDLNSSEINDLKNSLDAIKNEIINLKSLILEIEDLNTSVNGIYQIIETLKSDIAKLITDFNDNKTKTDKDIEDLKNNLISTITETVNNLNSLENKFIILTDKVSELENRPTIPLVINKNCFEDISQLVYGTLIEKIKISNITNDDTKIKTIRFLLNNNEIELDKTDNTLTVNLSNDFTLKVIVNDNIEFSKDYLFNDLMFIDYLNDLNTDDLIKSITADAKLFIENKSSLLDKTSNEKSILLNSSNNLTNVVFVLPEDVKYNKSYLNNNFFNAFQLITKNEKIEIKINENYSKKYDVFIFNFKSIFNNDIFKLIEMS